MIETAHFGRTGHLSTRVIFGAAGLGDASQEEADAVLELILAHGINHLDTAASYGQAELRMGPWMAEHRSRFFLATKTGERRGAAARQSLEQSLERLQVDQVDLVQLHDLVEEDDWQTAFDKGGAVEALIEARDEGLVRYIGITGHGLRIAQMHLRSLERYDFDSVLFPYNFPLLADQGYKRDVDRLIEVCLERRVALQTIKAIARRRYRRPIAPEPAFDSGTTITADRPERRISWYEPLDDAAPIARAVGYVLGTPDLFLVGPSDWRQLPAVLQAAASPGTMPTPVELAADQRAFGITALFDGGDLERI